MPVLICEYSWYHLQYANRLNTHATYNLKNFTLNSSSFTKEINKTKRLYYRNSVSTTQHRLLNLLFGWVNFKIVLPSASKVNDPTCSSEMLNYRISLYCKQEQCSESSSLCQQFDRHITFFSDSTIILLQLYFSNQRQSQKTTKNKGWGNIIFIWPYGKQMHKLLTLRKYWYIAFGVCCVHSTLHLRHKCR